MMMMMDVFIKTLLLLLFITTCCEAQKNVTKSLKNVTRSQRSYYYQTATSSVGGNNVYLTNKYGETVIKSASDYYKEAFICANNDICGQNAYCAEEDGHAVCCCLNGYRGDPTEYCVRLECIDDTECRGHQTCKDGSCVDVCLGVCGQNAECKAQNHVPVCSCPQGYTGDPLLYCRPFTPEELCHPNPCGPNTICEARSSIIACSCLRGYHGTPALGCRHECESDIECPDHQSCRHNKCVSPCSDCGENAECTGVRNHYPLCQCPKGYFGNPLLKCQPECVIDSDCPHYKPACVHNMCANPCENACGIDALCALHGAFPTCSCPTGTIGNPYEICRKIEIIDPCASTPCGINAICEAKDLRAICRCREGSVGNPLTRCYEGDCMENAHCPDNKACINYTCQNPCLGKCALNAKCVARRHVAVCSCPTSFTGDALTKCNLVYKTYLPGYYYKYV